MIRRAAQIVLGVLIVLASGATANTQGAYPLVGVWNCQGVYQSQYVFQPNGQYSAQSVFGPANGITHWGTWRMVGPTAARLYLQGWEPRTVTMPSEDNFVFQPVGPGQIIGADGSQCYRTG
jgi:hypothetical protein